MTVYHLLLSEQWVETLPEGPFLYFRTCVFIGCLIKEILRKRSKVEPSLEVSFFVIFEC